MFANSITAPTPLEGVQRDYDYSSLWYTRESRHFRPVHSKQALLRLIADTSFSLTLTVLTHPRDGVYVQLTAAENGGWFVEVASPYVDAHQVVRGTAPSEQELALVTTVAVSASRKAGGQALAYSTRDFRLNLDETAAMIGSWLAVQQPPEGFDLVPYARLAQPSEHDWPPDESWM